MKVVFVTPYYAPEYKFGGPPRKIAGLAKALLSRGHNVRVITHNSDRRTDTRSLEVDGVSVRYVNWRGTARVQLPVDSSVLRKELAAAEVIHCFGLYNLICPLAVRIATAADIPYFIEPMGMFVPRGRSFVVKRIYNRLITDCLFRKAAGIVATSKIEATEIAMNAAARNLVVRRNGIEPLDRAAETARGQFRRSISLDAGVPLVGYIGRISASKGLLTLVAAFSSLDTLAVLLIGGPVSDLNYIKLLKSAIAGSVASSRILLVDAFFGDDHRAALSSLDLFVLPSESENFGNAAGEAAMVGVPVLVTTRCGIAPIIDQKFGLTVEQGVENLRRGMEEMLASENRGRWSNPALARKELSWDEPVAQMEEIYREAIKQNAEKLKNSKESIGCGKQSWWHHW